jgi:hypothetical protein
VQNAEHTQSIDPEAGGGRACTQRTSTYGEGMHHWHTQIRVQDKNQELYKITSCLSPSPTVTMYGQ